MSDRSSAGDEGDGGPGTVVEPPPQNDEGVLGLPARGWPLPRLTRAALLDGEATAAPREAIGALLANCAEACFATARIRLAAVDLAPAELRAVRRLRVLLGQLDADSAALPLDGEARAGVRANLATLTDLLRSGRLEVRSAGAAAWYPDFSLYRGLRAGAEPGADALLVGAHWFGRPPVAGPALAVLVLGTPAVERAATRFERLWGRAYDVLPVVEERVARLAAELEDAAGGGARGGHPAPLAAERSGWPKPSDGVT